jgi:uncharacterized protein (DUF58 family)
METSELIKKVRKIEIKTRGLSKQLFSGEYHSTFKGRGMAFSEVREYDQGDDIRTIDWNVTARLNDPYVKIFEEERELTVMLLVDVSGSQSFGTKERFKRELITELSAILSFSAMQNNDKIGLILFSDKVEKYIPPKKGKSHVLRIIRELIEFEPESKGTDIGEALAYMTNVIRKRAIVFIMSDFISKDFEKPVKIAGNKHDTIAMRIYDHSEESLPDIGLVKMNDAETGEQIWIDTSSRSVRDEYKRWWESQEKELNTLFNKNKIDVIKLRTNESYISPLMNFFKKRENRR